MENRYWFNRYWFARGYLDGRTKGVSDDELFEMLTGDARVAYKDGYDAGVTDYCYYDVEVENGME